MPESERREVRYDDLRWIEPMDETGHLNGRVEVGVSPDSLIGKPFIPDGFLITWTSAVPRRAQSKQAAGVVLPMVTLSVPDYPSDNTVTVVWALPDARKIAREILASCDEAERVMKREQRHHDRLVASENTKRRVAESVSLTQCAWDGCKRGRSFFAPDGKGYCGRHADELGIRSTGKV